MADIVQMDSLDIDLLRRLSPGYVSNARYVVEKHESPTRTSIDLNLVQLATPYVKQWEWSDDYAERYRSVVAKGTSFLASEHSTPIGIAIAEPQQWNQILNVCEIHVTEHARRRGIGRLLMDKLSAVARERELRAIVCETQNTNVPAINFYRAVGFEMDCIDLSYYTNTDAEDFEVAVFMKLKLDMRTSRQPVQHQNNASELRSAETVDIEHDSEA
jgi:ribosomal protein S18 acetylase RimI-like enzyme